MIYDIRREEMANIFVKYVEDRKVYSKNDTCN